MTTGAPQIASLSLAALAAFALSSVAEAQRGGDRPTLTLYDTVEYSGRSIVIDGDAPDLRWVNFNDLTTSMRVNGGQWEVCLEPNYRGTCQVIDSSLPNMTQWAFNNRITSIRAVHRERRGSRRGITLWSGRNYTGRSVNLIRTEDSLRRLGFNDAANSIEVHSGRWTLCENSDFGGRCVELTRDSNDLTLFRMNDRVSAVSPDGRPQPAPPPSSGYPPSDGFQPGWGNVRITGGVRGVDTLFFPSPEVRGYPVARCLYPQRGGGRSADCGQATADAVCEINGFREAAFFSTRRVGGLVWFLEDRGAQQGRAQLTDVLCVR